MITDWKEAFESQLKLQPGESAALQTSVSREHLFPAQNLI